MLHHELEKFASCWVEFRREAATLNSFSQERTILKSSQHFTRSFMLHIFCWTSLPDHPRHSQIPLRLFLTCRVRSSIRHGAHIEAVKLQADIKRCKSPSPRAHGEALSARVSGTVASRTGSCRIFGTLFFQSFMLSQHPCGDLLAHFVINDFVDGCAELRPCPSSSDCRVRRSASSFSIINDIFVRIFSVLWFRSRQTR